MSTRNSNPEVTARDRLHGLDLSLFTHGPQHRDQYQLVKEVAGREGLKSLMYATGEDTDTWIIPLEIAADSSGCLFAVFSSKTSEVEGPESEAMSVRLSPLELLQWICLVSAFGDVNFHNRNVGIFAEVFAKAMRSPQPSGKAAKVDPALEVISASFVRGLRTEAVSRATTALRDATGALADQGSVQLACQALGALDEKLASLEHAIWVAQRAAGKLRAKNGGGAR